MPILVFRYLIYIIISLVGDIVERTTRDPNTIQCEDAAIFPIPGAREMFNR